MKKILIISTLLAMFCMTGIVYAAHTDDFDGKTLDKMWTLRAPKNNCEYTLEGGKLITDLKAGADMYIAGTDGGACFLMDPPAGLTDFSIEMMVNAAVDGPMPPACQPGLLFFNEAKWAYTVWGPYANTDIRLEDCVGASYRWRAETQIGIDMAAVAIDEDVWVKITKKGQELEFFAKGSENEKWVSAGIDKKLGPNYTPGDYQIGICLKSWGGSIDSTFEFEYFDIPEVPKAVGSQGKITSTWSAIKK